MKRGGMGEGRERGDGGREGMLEGGKWGRGTGRWGEARGEKGGRGGG